ncbi:uncharacterized protein At4g14450, chloroplastic-like [Impatiens glandulifera]|uniref:uncharacterized protein At4g14450, chloroplastic-like n=1 Tax=Impatiens glandulifera TaxID=253017 RepID=UPI001FB05FDF|nr:uncharacterized protein At4g14450, chloroplastic-like [Impatiens glandulifera]
MADKKKPMTNLAGARRQSSRLQRQAPASLQINPISDWNVAIPLLSPLVTSPESSRDWTTLEMKKSSSSSSAVHQTKDLEKTPTTVFKKWHHPASPFCYESAPTPHLMPFIVDNRS